jgi:hypothetical protein
MGNKTGAQCTFFQDRLAWELRKSNTTPVFIGVSLDASAQIAYWDFPLASGKAGVDVNSGEFYGDGPYPDPSAGFTGPFGFGTSFSASVEVIGHHGGCAQ